MRTFPLVTKEWWIRNYLKMIGTISSLSNGKKNFVSTRDLRKITLVKV